MDGLQFVPPTPVTLLRWRCGQHLTEAELIELSVFFGVMEAGCTALGPRYDLMGAALRIECRHVLRILDLRKTTGDPHRMD